MTRTIDERLQRAEAAVRSLEQRWLRSSPPLRVDPRARTKLKLWVATGSPTLPSERDDETRED